MTGVAFSRGLVSIRVSPFDGLGAAGVGGDVFKRGQRHRIGLLRKRTTMSPRLAAQVMREPAPVKSVANDVDFASPCFALRTCRESVDVDFMRDC